MKCSIYIGFDPREAAAFAVTRSSVRRHLTQPVPIRGLVLDELIAQGLYKRPTQFRGSAADRPVMWDVISDAPMSTQHANARFLVPHLARQAARIKVESIGGDTNYLKGPTGWALFMDGDMLLRDNLTRVFDGLDPSKAVYCVKHNHKPPIGLKMDGQHQTQYARKNWSSFMLFNCEHEANNELTIDAINMLPGRDLHRFCWLDDSEIGELDPKWNFLVGHSDPAIDPVNVHFTSGTPDMYGYESVAYADEWRAELARWAV